MGLDFARCVDRVVRKECPIHDALSPSMWPPKADANCVSLPALLATEWQYGGAVQCGSDSMLCELSIAPGPTAP